MVNSIAKTDNSENAIKEIRTICGRTVVLANSAFGFDDYARIFDTGYWQQRGSVHPTGSGRGSAWFITDSGQSLVLRHFRRGGAVAKALGNKYLFTGEHRVRSFREFRLLGALRQLDLPTAEPVAAGYERAGLFYSAQLLTRAIPDAHSWSGSLASGELSAQPWGEIGATIARFHRHGVCHADLNAHNILVNSQQQIYLIDFDKGSIKPANQKYWRADNISRLHRSVRKILALDKRSNVLNKFWPQLEEAYLSTFTQ